MIKKIISYLIDVLVLPVVNFFLNKHGDKVDVGVEYIDELIQLLTELRDTVKDKEITDVELDQIIAKINEIKDKISQ